MNEDGFGRKFLGDLVFGASENERSKTGAKKVAAFVVLFFFDGVLVERAEAVE